MPGAPQSFSSLAQAARIERVAIIVDPRLEFDAACEECFAPVRRYVLSRVRDPEAAQDLLGDIFERALRNWHTFEHRSTPRAWILGIARHVIADYRRQVSSRLVSIEVLAPEELLPDAESPEDTVRKKYEMELMRQTIAELDEREQDLLALRYVAELPFREIGAVLGIQEGAVRVRLHRVIGRLRAMQQEREG